MADTRLYVSFSPARLTAGTAIGATSMTLSAIEDVDGNTLTLADFGTKGYGVAEPGTDNAEFFTFTGISGTTVSGLSNQLSNSPYTESSGLKKPHAAGTKVILLSNTPGFYDQFLNKGNDETMLKVLTFTSTQIPIFDANPTLTDDKHVCTKKYADDLAIAGAPDGTTTVKGIFEQATAAELAAGTATGGTGANLVAAAADCGNVSSAKQMIPVTDADGDIPVEFMELDANWTFTGELDVDTATNFKLGGTAYTGSMADLNEASDFFQATDITGSEAESLTDDSTITDLHFHKRTAVAATRVLDAASGSVDYAHGLGATPKWVRISAAYHSTNGALNSVSYGHYDGTNTECAWTSGGSSGSGGAVDTTNIVHVGYNTGSGEQGQQATVSVDGTNVTLSWTRNGAATSVPIPLLIECGV